MTHNLITRRIRVVPRREIANLYHHVSVKYLDRYVDEYAFRLNEGSVKHHTLERITYASRG